MTPRPPDKWRPPLALVIGGTLAAFLSLPLIGIAYFRVAGNILGWAETAWLLGWVAVLATGLLAYLLWRLVLRPVYALTRYARTVRAGQTDAAPPSQFGTQEFSALSRSVAEMAETLEGRALQMRAYADHVTHELKSPLTALRGSAELLADTSDPKRQAELLSGIAQASTRMERLLDDLHNHARASQSSGPGQVRLSDATAGLDVQILQDAVLPLASGDMRTILEQMVQNAHAHGATEVTLHATSASLDIYDNGTGIPAGDRSRIFNPFFTTRRDTGGTGMGLSIVKSLLQAHGADIHLCDSDSGAHFRLVFPQHA